MKNVAFGSVTLKYMLKMVSQRDIELDMQLILTRKYLQIIHSCDFEKISLKITKIYPYISDQQLLFEKIQSFNQMSEVVNRNNFIKNRNASNKIEKYFKNKKNEGKNENSILET